MYCVCIYIYIYKYGGWFGIFFILPSIGNNDPNWLIFFRGVETTNQIFLHTWLSRCTFTYAYIIYMLGYICFGVFSGLVILITIYFQRILSGIYIHEPDIYGYWFGFYIYTYMESVCLYVDIFQIFTRMCICIYTYICFCYTCIDVLHMSVGISFIGIFLTIILIILVYVMDI